MESHKAIKHKAIKHNQQQQSALLQKPENSQKSSTTSMDINIYNAINASINNLIVALLALLHLKYQKKEISPLEEHGTIILLYILTCLFYSIAFIALMLQARQPPEIPFLAALEHIYLLFGALTCDLLILILAPRFGYFLLAFGGVVALLRSYQKIMGQGSGGGVPSNHNSTDQGSGGGFPSNHNSTDQGSGGGVPSNHNSTDQGSGGGFPSNHNSTDQGSGDHNTAPIENV